MQQALISKAILATFSIAFFSTSLAWGMEDNEAAEKEREHARTLKAVKDAQKAVDREEDKEHGDKWAARKEVKGGKLDTGDKVEKTFDKATKDVGQFLRKF